MWYDKIKIKIKYKKKKTHFFVTSLASDMPLRYCCVWEAAITFNNNVACFF